MRSRRAYDGFDQKGVRAAEFSGRSENPGGQALAQGAVKDKAKVDVWLKSIAPSSELRTWFRHDVEKWPEFKVRYFAELDGNAEAVEELLAYTRENKVVLVYGAKDPRHNHAVVLLEYLHTLAR